MGAVADFFLGRSSKPVSHLQMNTDTREITYNDGVLCQDHDGGPCQNWDDLYKNHPHMAAGYDSVR